jgi:integrase/recombinase XerD
MNRTVNVLKRVTTEKGSRYCAVVEAANGRIKPDYVIVDGKQEFHKEGSYYLSWYEGSKLKRVSVGKNASAADARRHKQEQILAARNTGLVVADPAESKSPLLVNAATEYLAEIEAQKKRATHRSYRNCVQLFLQSCSKQTVAEVDRGDLLAFITFLRQRGFAAYTVRVTFGIVWSFLKAAGKEITLNRGDWPKYTKEEPEAYERETLGKFFAACSEQEHLWFSFFLMTGMRDQEVRYCSWKCVNFHQSTISVRHNPEHGWTPKAYKERTVPVPQRLMDALKAWRDQRDKKCDLLFPTFRCKPNLQFLHMCKAIAERAELDPATFWLHKFRATFATWHLWAGVDLRTVMNWMGHSDITSTMRYLKPNGGQAVRDKVEATFG